MLQYCDIVKNECIAVYLAFSSVYIAISFSQHQCRNSTGHPSEENQVVVAVITSMRMDLTYYNLGEQALNFQILLTLPEGFILVTPETELVCVSRSTLVPFK